MHGENVAVSQTKHMCKKACFATILVQKLGQKFRILLATSTRILEKTADRNVNKNTAWTGTGGCDSGERGRDGGKGRGLRARDVTGRGLDSLRPGLPEREGKLAQKFFDVFTIK